MLAGRTNVDQVLNSRIGLINVRHTIFVQSFNATPI